MSVFVSCWLQNQFLSESLYFGFQLFHFFDVWTVIVVVFDLLRLILIKLA